MSQRSRRLRNENARLKAEVARLRAEMRKISSKVYASGTIYGHPLALRELDKRLALQRQEMPQLSIEEMEALQRRDVLATAVQTIFGTICKRGKSESVFVNPNPTISPKETEPQVVIKEEISFDETTCHPSSVPTEYELLSHLLPRIASRVGEKRAVGVSGPAIRRDPLGFWEMVPTEPTPPQKGEHDD